MYYIGIDLGGTTIKGAIVDESGQILIKDSVPTLNERPYEEIVKDMSQLVIDLMEKQNIQREQVISVGIGTPGSVTPEKGMILYSNNIKQFNNVPICKMMNEYLGLPIYVENDANCAALGESIGGAAKGFKNSITITLGTGVGSGIILDHKIMAGSYHNGAEIGHTVINVNGEQCTCGRKGCFEAYSSATALIRDAKKAALANPQSLLNQLTEGNLENMNAKIVFDSWHEKDEAATKVVENYLEYLAIGLANIINIFEPEVLVIGGGISGQKEALLNPLIPLVNSQTYGFGDTKTLIKIAELGNDAGLIGAAFLN